MMVTHACRFVDDFVNGHVTQQSHFIFNPQGECAVDYIARTEYLSDDWKEILTIVQERTGLKTHESPMRAAKYQATPGTTSVTNHACLSERVAALAQLDAETTQAIAMQHAMDVSLLGFLPPPVGSSDTPSDNEFERW